MPDPELRGNRTLPQRLALVMRSPAVAAVELLVALLMLALGVLDLCERLGLL